MARARDPSVALPEIVTLHWEGPPSVEVPPELPESLEQALADERERRCVELRRLEHGRALWDQIESEAARRGDDALWRRKLHAYRWVKLERGGSAGDYARRHQLNHATVRSWIHDVARLAYEVGYRLHEDKLLLVGDAPEELRRLRELVNRDAASAEAWQALRQVEADFRGEDPYFHLNEGHVLRARGRLRESEEALKEGLTIAEARRVRSLLWNARGQTFWDCLPDSSWPLPDHVERAEMAFRRAAILDASTYFPFVNLAQLAVDAGDVKRAEYWIGELAMARRGMEEAMQDALAKYLDEAEWTPPVERSRYWRNGPIRWIREAMRKGVLPALLLALVLGLAAPQASAEPWPDSQESPANGGAGGN